MDSRSAGFPDRFTVRISDPGGIAAALPFLLGFRPEESVVLVSLLGRTPPRVGLSARVDIPPPDAADAVARSLTGTIAAGRPSGAVLALVSEAPDRLDGPFGAELPHAHLVRAFVRALARGGVPARSLLLVRGGRWWSYDCPHPCCAPGAGTPLPAGVSDLELAGVATGRVVGRDRRELAARIPTPSARRAEDMARRVRRAVEERAAAVAVRGGPAVAEESWRGLLAALETLRPGGSGLPDAMVARLLADLRDDGVRDRALRLALGPDADAAALLWTECAGRAPAPFDAPPATLLAACCWLDGDGAMANVALDRALGGDPGYSLARLLRWSLAAGMPRAQLRAAIAGDR